MTFCSASHINIKKNLMMIILIIIILFKCYALHLVSRSKILNDLRYRDRQSMKNYKKNLRSAFQLKLNKKKIIY